MIQCLVIKQRTLLSRRSNKTTLSRCFYLQSSLELFSSSPGMTCCRWSMRFWIIASRILQSHLFWGDDLSQCGKGWIVLALKWLNRYFLVAAGGREHPRMMDGFGGSSQLTGFQKMTYSTQDKLDYVGMATFADLSNAILKLDVVVFALHQMWTATNWHPAGHRPPLFEPAPGIQSSHKDENWKPGPFFYGHCQSKRVVSQERMFCTV